MPRFPLPLGILSLLLSSLLLPMNLLAEKRVEPVAAVASQGFRIITAQGPAVEPFVISLDWSKPQPKITRAVVVFHGVGRDVEGYYRTVQEAAEDAGSAARDTVFIAPQFLEPEDIDAHHIPSEVLRWQHTAWEAGAAATAPFPVSSYEVVDALLRRLGDHAIFPNLKTVVLAGHSGGGQLVQRYAVVGRETAVLAKAGIRVRFVIANPSSYVYFSDERPAAGGTLAPFKSDECRDFNRWKYGTVDPPAYVKVDADNSWAQMEAAYAQRDVTYLLGTKDTDPHEKDLDVSCRAEAQGPMRFARGQAYYAYLHSRSRSDWNQRLWFVPGVAHSARQMFTSRCGVNALFDAGHCPDQ
jgi:pimeloyl-ACP methyl ester carboxylesterase